MIVLDASVLIGHFDGRDALHERANSLLEATGADALGAASITVAETLVAPARTGRLEEAVAALERLGVVELALGERSAIRLAELRADTGLKMPDCCVLAAAQHNQGAVATFDKTLEKAAAMLKVQCFNPLS